MPSRERYVLIRCPRCRNLLTSDTRYASRTCPRCRKRIDLAKVKVIGSSRDARVVARLLQELSLRDAGE